MMGDNSITSLPRQSGLLETAQIIANNIANASTPGFKAEGPIFAEYVSASANRQPSTSIGHLVGHSTDFSGGAFEKTGNTFDFGIEGDGFFKVTTPGGDRLTRAGVFQLDPNGMIADAMGNTLQDEGGSAIQIPPDAVSIAVARDGTLSVDGEIFGNVGVFEPIGEMERAGANQWVALDGDRLKGDATILQGFVEQSNVSPVLEFAKLISAQRLYEAGQTMAEQEHDRLSSLINAIRQQG
ncbi:flagellar hook-basal body complex protein [Parvularcula sp. LCG005]|uniref:flagellar hook-basal body complex protein n=1 Tax=Parvularcula sp. LCG005 TaxID=3078805 RepID=UPI00294343AA|nr:flagellar hook-basal body complex protein [Parvularcula sp. LCG005]WOI52691.1 flagellar hook-basal body complex protein [Parvularcula sp. LCG005]